MVAQTEVTPQPKPESAEASSSRAEQNPWDFNISVFAFVFSNENAYLQPTLAVDHGWLHLEGRYNDEALQTGSLWVGWNFRWGKALKFTLTPMVGWVFGQVNGAAPGLEWSLGWGPLAFSSQNEFVVNFANVQQSFFLTWTELTVQPFQWLLAGVALQRTRTYIVPRAVTWGPLLGVTLWNVQLAVYWFDPAQANIQYLAASITVSL